MGWARDHIHSWEWAVDDNDMVLSLIFPRVVFGWQVCKCGQWRIHILKEQAAA